MGRTQKIGTLGETIANAFVQNKGYVVLMRNYRKKWGEIDIIAQREGRIHFIEVKTISQLSCEQKGEYGSIVYTPGDDLFSRENKSSVSYETYRPEENMHPKKIERLQRAIQSYLIEYNCDNVWQLDLVAVEIYEKTKKARCKLISNVL